MALRTVPDGGTGRDTLTANSVMIGDGINQVKLVTATTNGKVLGVAAGEWAEIDVPNTITGVTAGNGLSGGGTSGNVTLTVNANGENVTNRGQTALVNLTGGGQALGVVLGTSGFTAAAGNHTHNVVDIDDSTTVGRNLVKLTNPSAIRFVRINADNTVSALSAADMRTAIDAAATSHTHTALEISDSTATGRAVLTAADAAAARTAIGAGTGNGTVTSVQAGNGLSGGNITGSGTLTVNANGETVTNRGQTALVNLTGGGQGLGVVLGTSAFTAAAGNHGHTINAITDATTVGQNLVKLANPGAIRFLRVNSNNTVSALTDSEMRTAIGAGTGNGTVTSVGGTGNVSGITLSGTVTSSGNLTLGGTLSVNLGTSVTGTLAIANGGTGATTAAQARTNLGAGTVTSVASGTGLTGGPITGSGTLSLAGQALNLFNQTTTGFFVRTGAGSIVARSIAVTGSNAVTITNGDGSAGNPTLQMSTPGTLTKTSTNSNTTAHTHALDGSIADVTVTASAPTGSPSRAGSLHFVV
jgi:hypothetical protein